MTQYLLSVHHSGGDVAPLSQEDMAQSFKDVDAFNNELQASGNWVFAGGLHAPSTATVVRIGDDNSVITTDGPYAETKEQLGGFWVISGRRPRRRAGTGGQGRPGLPAAGRSPPVPGVASSDAGSGT